MAYASYEIPVDVAFGMEHNEFWNEDLNDYDDELLTVEMQSAARGTVQRLLVEALPTYAASYADETEFMDAVSDSAKLQDGLDRYLVLAVLFHYFESVKANPGGRDAQKAEDYYLRLTKGVLSWSGAVQSATQAEPTTARRTYSVWAQGKASWGTAPS